ncbi:hypothetical protein SAMN03159448_03785 [Sinorhizobium sp. NFACC03]|nr:hypothetical protein SAMN03159448_03785 [Sinorhizobium sp. NFACC03]
MRARWRIVGSPFKAVEALSTKLERDVVIDEITRGSIDGGRDAVGRYRIGLIDDPVYAAFSLEAKCYRLGNGVDNANTVGVKEVARLISRIRPRGVGVPRHDFGSSAPSL